MARGPRDRTAPDGVVVVDKPAGLTSHDVVAQVRRLVGSRKVGHAGTLDPMATGVLVCGVERATRILGLLADGDKEYRATVRLGVSTVSDDADGEVVSAVGLAALEPAELEAVLAPLRGHILQRPSSVSAIKVDGRRAHERVRAGEDVDLPARPVHVEVLEVLATTPGADVRTGAPVIDVDVRVVCSAGTYVRSLARDAGASLGCGGHLVSLRRTRVGPFGVDRARTLDELAGAAEGDGSGAAVLPLADVLRTAFPVHVVDDGDAVKVGHGTPLPWPVGVVPDGPVALLSAAGAPLALGRCRGGTTAYLVVFS